MIDREVNIMGEIESLPVRVIVEPASMIKYLSTFHHGVEEVALIAHPQETGGGVGGGTNGGGAPTVEFKSYVDPNKSQIDDSLHAMISIYNTLPFASYSNSLDSLVEIVFNIKDFKAMLTLSEVLGTNIELTFKEPSQPLVVVSHFLDGYGGYVKARLVVSTIDNSYSAAYQGAGDQGAVGNAAGLLLPPPSSPPREEIQHEDNYGKHLILLMSRNLGFRGREVNLIKGFISISPHFFFYFSYLQGTMSGMMRTMEVSLILHPKIWKWYPQHSQA